MFFVHHQQWKDRYLTGWWFMHKHLSNANGEKMEVTDFASYATLRQELHQVRDVLIFHYTLTN